MTRDDALREIDGFPRPLFRQARFPHQRQEQVKSLQVRGLDLIEENQPARIAHDRPRQLSPHPEAT